MDRFDDIESVIDFAEGMSEFPRKNAVVECLEARNMNRYQQALAFLAEARHEQWVLEGELIELEQRIKSLAASDLVSE